MKASIQIARYARIHLLFLILFLLPNCGYSIQHHHSDTTYVLTIFHYENKTRWEGEKPISYWEKKKKVSYIYPGATVDLKMRGDWEINQGQILSIEKESMIIDRQRIYFSEIQEISLGTEAKRRGNKFLGLLLFALGLLVGIWWFHINFGLKYGDNSLFLKGIIFPALVIVAGINKLGKSNQKFTLHGPESRLESIPLTSISERLQKKLARKLFIN
ncbi:MAG: hypothetical protein AAFR87_17365 [Bacteroidota bacterium]